MVHRFDLHTHSFFSKDAANAPELLIKAAKNRGLSGMAITDHNSCGAHAYLRERGLAREDGEAVGGFLVIPGVEVSTAEGHLLCIGTTLPDMLGAPALEVCNEILSRGGIPIPAHPYDSFRAGIAEHVLDTLPIQNLEVFNAAVSVRSFNDKADEYARRRGLVPTAASDAHHSTAVGVATTALDIPELTVAAVLQQLRVATELETNYLTFLEGMRKHLGNWFRMFNPRPHMPEGRSE